MKSLVYSAKRLRDMPNEITSLQQSYFLLTTFTKGLFV